MVKVAETPISSFPGIWKYPDGRNGRFRNAMDWMASKQKYSYFLSTDMFRSMDMCSKKLTIVCLNIDIQLKLCF